MKQIDIGLMSGTSMDGIDAAMVEVKTRDARVVINYPMLFICYR